MEAVLFDLDDTLNHRRPSLESYARRLLEDFSAVASFPDVFALLVRADQGGYNAEGRPHELAAAPVWRVAPEVRALREHWDRVWSECVVVRAGAHELLGALREAGWKLGVVTNGRDAVQRAKLARLAFDDLLDAVVVSESAGVKKPDPRIFAHAAHALGAAAGDCVFVGDHPTNDVIGSARAGLTAVWLRGSHPWPDGAQRPQHAVDGLDDVFELVRSWGPG